MFSRVFNTCFYTLLAHIQELFRKGSSLKRNTLISYKENTSLTRKVLYMQWKKLDNELNQKEESLIDTITE